MRYLLKDTSGVYDDVVIKANFRGKAITEPAMRHISVGMAKAITIKAMAIEKMFDARLCDVDEKVVQAMFQEVSMQELEND